MSHVDEGQLHAYLDGALESGERADVIAHLAACADCRVRLEEERALATRARELLALAAPAERALPPFRAPGLRPASGWRVPLTWAATLTIAFATGWYARALNVVQDVSQPVAVATGPAPAHPAELAPAPSPSIHVRNAPPVGAPPARRLPSAAPAERAADALAAGAAPARNDVDPWLPVDAAGAAQLLGQAPAVLADAPIRRIARNLESSGLVLIEQEVRPGVVIRLYERGFGGPATPPPVASGREAGKKAAAPNVASGYAALAAAPASERLARYVGGLRVEIAGPLPADSLSRLLELVR